MPSERQIRPSRTAGARSLSIAWLATTLAVALPLSSVQAGDPVEPATAPSDASTAKAAFARGVELYERGAVGEALEQFETAHRIAPDYRVLYNIAVAQARLGRDVEALATFARYVREGGDALSSERVASVQAQVRELEARVCTVRVEATTEGASVVVDGTSIGSTPLPEPLHLGPGHHELVVSMPEHQPYSRAIEARAGERVVVIVPGLRPVDAEPTPPPPEPTTTAADAEPPPPPAPTRRSRLRPATWGLVGVTSASLVATVVLASSTYVRGRRFDAALATFPAPDVDADRDALRRFAIATDVMIGATATLAAVTIGIGIASALPERSRARTSTLSISPAGVRF